MDPVLELPREREEAERDARQPETESEARANAYVFDGWSYEPLQLARSALIS